MDIEIIGSESMGVRSLCCFVKTRKQQILIDPGIALGYTRKGLLPHPLQVAVDERIQKLIKKRWTQATDIVFSHYHGDHIPLVDANPYQLKAKDLKGPRKDVRIWGKDVSNLSATQIKRADAISTIFKKEPIIADGNHYGSLTFSEEVPHGKVNSPLGTVIMTKITENITFVHASDIQLLNDRAINKILDWSPDIVLVGGPPLYLSGKLSKYQIDKAWNNAKILSLRVDKLILDHHIMRNYEGIKWLKRLSDKSGKDVMCSADFMKKPRMLLEAKREQLYMDMKVPETWHKDYAKGKVSTEYYWDLAKGLYKSIQLIV
jgi:predicted metallo-beta-lactamase superfamily hydrolase